MKAKHLVLGLLVGLCGCQAGPQNFEQSLLLVEKAAAVAADQGISHHTTLRWNGKGGLAYVQKAEVDSGMFVEIHFQGNAQEDVPDDSGETK